MPLDGTTRYGLLKGVLLILQVFGHCRSVRATLEGQSQKEDLAAPVAGRRQVGKGSNA